MVFLILSTIILISLFTLFPVFNVGLYGDDWLAIFRYIVHVIPPSKEGWNLLTYYLTPYGSQDIIMGLLYQAFGTNSFYFEITSYLFRMLAAFSLYPLILYLTKNKLATYFAILFFAITTTGFDSTGWLLTMPTYLTIAFFNIFLYFYILFHDTKNRKFLLFSCILFYLAYVTASARMIGAPMFIFSLETFWLIRDRKVSNLKLSLLRIFAVIFVLVIISITGHSLGNGSDWLDRLSSGISTIGKLTSEGRTDFLLYPIVTFGGMFIPNFIVSGIQVSSHSDMLLSVAIPSLLLFIIMMFIIKSNIANLTKQDLYKSLASAAIWILFVFIIRKININTFSSSTVIYMLAIGGLVIIAWVFLFIRFFSQKNIVNALFISFSWALSSFFPTWIWAPGSYTDSTHRYLTTSAVGLSILFAVIISLGKKSKNSLYLTILLTPILLIHIAATRTYIEKLLNSHSNQAVNLIWSSLPKVPQLGKEPLVFYFRSNDSNNSILGDSVLFGFPFHIALLYNLRESSTIPVPMSNWTEVVSAVKDGQSFKAYGYPLKPIPVENVYAFSLQGSDTLINITDAARQKLIEEKQK